MANNNPFREYNQTVGEACNLIRLAFKASMNEWFKQNPHVTKVHFETDEQYNDEGYSTVVSARLETIMDVDPDDLEDLLEDLTYEASDYPDYVGKYWTETFSNPAYSEITNSSLSSNIP